MRVLEAIGKSTQHKNGYWAVACVKHTFIKSANFYSNSFKVPMNSANTIQASMFAWVSDDKSSHLHMDTVPWPENKPCSGVAELRKEEQIEVV